MIFESKPWKITYTDGSVRYTITPTKMLARLIARDAYKPVQSIGRVQRVPESAGRCYGVLSQEVTA